MNKFDIILFEISADTFSHHDRDIRRSIDSSEVLENIYWRMKMYEAQFISMLKGRDSMIININLNNWNPYNI